MDLHIRHFIGRKKLLKDEQLNLHVEEGWYKTCLMCDLLLHGTRRGHFACWEAAVASNLLFQVCQFLIPLCYCVPGDFF